MGIIDGGFEGFNDLVVGGELTAVVGARCYSDIGEYSENPADCEIDGVHGTAVAESVVDIAPGVSLYIAIPQSQGDVNDIVDWMVSEGVSVINMSLSWAFTGPGDGTSPFSWSVLNAVDHAVEGGITWANSASNRTRQTWFNSGPFSDTDGDGLIEFDGSDESNGFELEEEESALIQLRWEDNWGGASSDLDFYVVEQTTGQRVSEGMDYQSGGPGDIPYEISVFTAPSDGVYEVFIEHINGSVPDWIQLMVWSGWLEHPTANGSITSPAESANPGMLAVGATHYWNTDNIASYSSRGPTPDGRVKPDIVGTACAEVVSYEPIITPTIPCWFPGTSQASPHVAGLAALVKQQFPGYTPDRVADYLKHYAEQREAPDPNNTWGHGFAVLPPPDDTEPPPGFDTSCGQALTANSAVQDQWTTGCNSETPAPGQGGSGARLARYYTFTLTESAEVSVILESDDAETVLYLREGAGVRSGDPMDSNEGESEHNYRRASVQQSLNAGTYTIDATTYNAGETGSFTLTVSVAGGTAPPPVAGDCGIADIATDGSAVQGTWANDCRSEETAGHNARYYTFTLNSAADVTITLDSDDGDQEPVLHLRDGTSKTGTEVAVNEGIGPDYLRAEIVENLEAGTYTIEARTYSQGYEGPFTLTVSVAGGSGSDPCGQTLQSSSDASGYLLTPTWSPACQSQESGRGYAWYLTFTLVKESPVTIKLESGDANPYLYLREGEARSGSFLYENDNHQGSTEQSRIVATLTAGTYTIEATTNDPGQTGTFTLEVGAETGAFAPEILEPCAVGQTLRPGESCSHQDFTIRVEDNGDLSLRFSGSAAPPQGLDLSRSGNTWTIVSLP